MSEKSGAKTSQFSVTSSGYSAEALRDAVAAERRDVYDVFMQAPAMIAIVRGSDMVIEFANPFYLRVVGRTDSIIGRPLLEAFPEFKDQPIMEILKRVYAEDKAYNGNEVNVKIDNNNDGLLQDMYFNFVYQPLRNIDGEVIGLMTHAVEVTQQVLARKKAEEDEARYRTLFNSIDEGFCIIEILLDNDGKPADYRFLETNKVFEKLTGLKEVTGKTVKQTIPDIESTWIEKYGKVALTGESVRFTENSDALNRWFDVHASKIGGEDSRKVALLFTDVTQRKTREQQLQQSEVYYREIADNTPVMTWITDKHGDCTYVNKQWRDYTGQKPQEALGIGWMDVVHPEDLQHTKAVFKDASTSHEPINLEYRLRHVKGEYRWALDSGLPKFATDGSYDGFVGSVIDIDDRKQAENSLRQQLTLNEAVMNNTTVGLFMIDAAGLMKFINPAATKLLGYSQRECIGKSSHVLMHHSYPDGRPYPQSECPLALAYKLGQLQPTREDVFYRKDGSQFTALVTATPIMGENDVQGTIVELRDVTEQKKTLDRKKQLETITARLREQRSQLISINKSKDEFISLASHQLRTPATGVKQYLGMVLDGFAGDLSVAQRKMLEQANTSNERQITIINDLLKVAQVDAGKVNLRKEQVDVVGLVRRVLADQKSQFESLDQKVELTAEKNIMALLDAHKIQMVLDNIVDNAGKYTPSGKNIVVSVSTEGHEVAVAVTDEGVGIAPEELDKLFKKFVRLDNPLSVKVGGTGLGLYWADKIVALHGGSISVDSKVGHGTTFTIRLPR